jgi:GNAT superfamily N-acetyltransferase
MSDLTFKLEKLDEVRWEMEPMLIAHWAETAMYKDKVPYAPAWDKYYNLENAGVLKIVTARLGDRLIGYFVATLLPNMHYSDTLYALNDILYIDPAYRNAGNGTAMLVAAEQIFKGLGAQVITVHMKVYAPFDGICKALDWDYTERIYTKYIGD